MQTKDWILLFVPIVSNGVILYFVQLYFQKQFKKSEHKSEVKQRINNDFFSLLLAAKNNFRLLNHCVNDEPNNSDRFEHLLYQLNQSIRQLLDFYSDYKVFLAADSSAIDRLDAVFNEYVEVGRNMLTLTEENKKQLESYLKQILNLLSSAISRYVKEI